MSGEFFNQSKTQRQQVSIEHDATLETVLEDASNEVSTDEQRRIVRRILEILIKKSDELHDNNKGRAST